MTQILTKPFTRTYDADRLEKAVARAARANHVPVGDADHLAKKVAATLEAWISHKPEITAKELRLATANALATFDPGTAYLYENENKLF